MMGGFRFFLLERVVIVIPAIDLKDGKCVRLAQGDFRRVTVYSEDPVEIAERWRTQGAQRIHVVDLDGSLAGSPRNRAVIVEIIKAIPIPVELGGGIRDMNTVEYYIRQGVQWVILGTAALRNETFVKDACRQFSGRIIIGIDARDGRVAVQGWTEKTSETAADIARRYENHEPAAIVYTDIQRDGMESGVNIEATRILAEAVNIPIIASGGVAGMSDIEQVLKLETAGVMGVIVGKALYTGGLSLEAAIDRTKK
jgi:phosphoribosylformimino-5-aminoimidazole carboxamide ribotide isomerase